MKGSKFGFIGKPALIVVALAVAFLGSSPIPADARSQPASPSAQEQIILNFLHGDGNGPSGLIRDAVGNLYGTTSSGGAGKVGNVFELSPKQGGGWSFTVLHTFGLTSGDGTYPAGTLTMDASGNLHGATLSGGAGGIGECANGCGTVFELSPKQGGGWTEEILYSFTDIAVDGAGPNGDFIFDASGNLYGTTRAGGNGGTGGGTVFELSPQEGGAWTKTTLYTFSDSAQGFYPYVGMVLDATGNLYGTTYGGGDSSCDIGGSNGCGTVFELSPQRGGGWTESVIHNFQDGTQDGQLPYAGLVLDSVGNLYGVTTLGGTSPCFSYGCGIVFELSPKSGGKWAERILHNFAGGPQDGEAPLGSLIFNQVGGLWGTTSGGGTHGNGAVFELLPQSGGRWTEKIRHSFKSRTQDGQKPQGPLTLDPAGNIYGTTFRGGTAKGGTVFEVTP